MQNTIVQAVAAIPVKLHFDFHLAHSELAKEKNAPDSMLACAECMRALWMHGTRHETCTAFCWVTEHSVTTAQLQQLLAITGLPPKSRAACTTALNSDNHAPGHVREAKRFCCVVINSLKNAARESR